MATIIRQPSKAFIDALESKGFSIQDCPCCEIQPEWETLPIIKAIRETEQETGEQYQIRGLDQ